jgi:chromosomal replication initiation ATPase DnaA
MLSGDRHQAALNARQVVCYVARLLGLSYSEIGREFEQHHTTIINAVVRVGETPRLRGIAASIAAELGWDRTVESEAS